MRKRKPCGNSKNQSKIDRKNGKKIKKHLSRVKPKKKQ